MMLVVKILLGLAITVSAIGAMLSACWGVGWVMYKTEWIKRSHYTDKNFHSELILTGGLAISLILFAIAILLLAFIIGNSIL